MGRANFLEISMGVARRDCGRHRPRRVKLEGTPRLDFDPSLMLRYPDWVITSGAELLAIASWTTRSRVVLLAWGSGRNAAVSSIVVAGSYCWPYGCAPLAPLLLPWCVC